MPVRPKSIYSERASPGLPQRDPSFSAFNRLMNGHHILKSRRINNEDAMKTRSSEEEAKSRRPLTTLPVSTSPSDVYENLDRVLPLAELQILSTGEKSISMP